MPNEKTLARYITKGLRAYGHVQRHEDALSVGVADLSFAYNGVTAWIELKALDAWPKRPGTLVRLRTFTAEQLNWLTLRGNHTPYVFLLLKVEDTKEYLLFNHDVLKAIKEGVIQEQMRVMTLPLGPWQHGVNFSELVHTLGNEWQTTNEWETI